MKKFLLALLIITASTTACATSPVEKYIREKVPNIQSLKMIEMGAVDSLYSPFNTLLSAGYFYDKMMPKVAETFEDACNASSRAESLAILNKLIDSTGVRYRDISSTVDEAITRSITPFDGSKFNRIGCRIKYNADGNIKEDIFVYNNDGETIGHTFSELNAKTESVAHVGSNIRKALSLIEAQIEGINTGQIKYNSWR